MLLRLDNPAMFSKVIEIISELVADVRLKVNEFGMSITAIDPANVALVGFRMPKGAFSQFESDNETLGINLEDFKKILKRCNPRSPLILERAENLLVIKIEDKIRRIFKLNLIEIESEDIDFNSKTERMEFSSRVELTSSDFIASIEDCSVVADACSFIIDREKFVIEARSLNSARSEFTQDEAKINGEDCKSRYSLEYLSKFIKGSKLSEKTILNFAHDHPLKLDIKAEQTELSFVLAPRVETDD